MTAMLSFAVFALLWVGFLIWVAAFAECEGD